RSDTRGGKCRISARHHLSRHGPASGRPDRQEFRAAQDPRPCGDYKALSARGARSDTMVANRVESAMALPALMMAALIAASPASRQTPAAAAQTPAQESSSADAYFYFLQGHMLEGTGDVPGAIDAYQKAIAASPGSADIRAELAGVYARA